MGGYVNCSVGLCVFFKIENPPMHRIYKLFVGEEAEQPDQMYRAAFTTEHGVPEKFGKNRQQHADKTVDVLQAYLRKHRPVEIGLRGIYTAI
jgi:S-sulfosulfanyl-L-cysteine sulfohydrolase